MRQIRRATPLFVVALLGAGVIVGSLVRPLAMRFESTSPQVTWGPSIMFFVMALLVGALAWGTWQALHKKHERMTSDHGVKMLALSRASLIVACLFGATALLAICWATSLALPVARADAVAA